MTAPDRDLAVIVVNYGSHHLLERNLTSVAAAVPGGQVVVVDNFTTMGERGRVQGLCDERGWRALLLMDNVGFGSGINRAVALLGPEVRTMVLLNPDATIDQDSVSLLRAHVAAHPRDLAAPMVKDPLGRMWSEGVDLHLKTGEMAGWQRRAREPDPTFVQPWLSGACLVLSRDLWDRTGGFDDDYFLYWEDVDLSRRVLAAGGRVVVVTGAVAIHDEGGTQRGDTPTRAKSATYYYFNTRNRLLFAAKHLDRVDQRRWVRTAPVVGFRILLEGGRRQLVHPRSTVLPAMRGTLDGWRELRRRR